RRLYGIRAAWLAVAILCFEPNFAAHIPVGAIDVLGVEAIVITCFVAWRYFERPTIARLVPLCAALAAALLTKHTTIILPAVIIGFGIVRLIGRAGLLPRLFDVAPKDGSAGASPSRRASLALVYLLIAVPFVLVLMWAMTGFDISHPAVTKSAKAQAVWPMLPE